MRNVNPETITDTLSWNKILPLNGLNLSRAKQRSSQETGRSLFKVLGTVAQTESCKNKQFDWSLANLVKIYDGIIELQHLIDPWQKAYLKEPYEEWKEGTSAVLLQLGLDEIWWAGSMECYCHLRNVQNLLAAETIWRTTQKGLWYLLEQRVGDHRTSPKDQANNSSIWLLSITSNLSGLWADRGWNLERRLFDSRPERSGEKLDASDIHPRRLNAKEMLIRQKMMNPSGLWADRTAGIVRKGD